MENLLKAAKELENKLAQGTAVEKEAVIEVMMDQWEAGRQEERNIAGEFLSAHIQLWLF